MYARTADGLLTHRHSMVHSLHMARNQRMVRSLMDSRTHSSHRSRWAR